MKNTNNTLSVSSAFEWPPSVQNVLKKLNDRIKNKFSGELSLFDLESFDRFLPESPVKNEIKTQLSRNQTVWRPGLIYIPILTSNKKMSVVVLSFDQNEVKGKSKKDIIDSLKSFSEIIKALLTHAVESAEKINDLDEKAAEIQNSSRKSSAESRVFYMSDYKESTFDLLGSPKSEYQDDLDYAFLIEAATPEDVYKMSLEIHHWAARLAYLKFNDLEKGIEQSIEELSKLGSLTIFVSEVLDLSLEQQAFILKYLEQRDPFITPQFIFGTSSTYTQLKVSPSIDQSFLRHISTGYLVLTQPFEFYKNKNVMYFFFEGLSGRLNEEVVDQDYESFTTTKKRRSLMQDKSLNLTEPDDSTDDEPVH